MINKFLQILIFNIVVFINMGCDFGAGSGGTTTGNPIVQIKFSAFNQTQANKISKYLNVEAQSVTSLLMCFKRLRFKKEDSDLTETPETDKDNIDLDLNEVNISASGTNLTTVSIESGIYTRIEFDLERDCESGSSIQFVNNQGSFNSDERVTIKFEGQFNAKSGFQTLNLGIQNIVDSLEQINDNSDIKSTLEGLSGEI
jgi:hypothetical protein